MLNISYGQLVVAISVLWLLMRATVAIRCKTVRIRREVLLLLVYICLVVVVRFTFFPFGTVNGQIQPLVLDVAHMWPPRINLVPFVYLFDYPEPRDAWLNVIGNTAMFIPLGIVWPSVFYKLRKPLFGITAGIGVSLCIELLQLPFFERVSDLDDLLLNSAGFIIGYALFLAVRGIARSVRKKT